MLLAQVRHPLGRISNIGGFEPDASLGNAPTQLESLISTIIGTLTIFAGLAFLLYFIIGAINWITSSGDQQKLDSAKSQMTSAGTGLVIVVAAFAVIGIVGSVLGIDIINFGTTINNLTPGT